MSDKWASYGKSLWARLSLVNLLTAFKPFNQQADDSPILFSSNKSIMEMGSDWGGTCQY